MIVFQAYWNRHEIFILKMSIPCIILNNIQNTCQDYKFRQIGINFLIDRK